MGGRRRLAVLVLVLAFTAWACGGDSDSSSGGDDTTGGHGHDMSGDFAFGEPGDAADASRTIEVAALDTLKFDPDAIEVEPGETVTFVVTNEGSLDHEFLIGDESFQEEHSAGMSGEHSTDEANLLALDPGETDELTWTFAESGAVLYACHVEDHYQHSMVGTFEFN